MLLLSNNKKRKDLGWEYALRGKRKGERAAHAAK